MKKITTLLFVLTLILSGAFFSGKAGAGSAFAASPQIGYMKRKGRKIAHRTKYHTKRISHKTKITTKRGFHKSKHVTKHTYRKTKNKIEH